MSLGHIITYLCYIKDLNRIFAKKFGNTSVRDAILTYYMKIVQSVLWFRPTSSLHLHTHSLPC